MQNRLKELRKALGLKQREVAERLGVIVSLVGKWESGQQDLPKTRIYQICREYNVNEDWLVNGRGDMFAPLPPPVDEREAQRRFVLNCFRSLPESARAVLLDALREYVGESARNNNAVEINGDNNGTVNQTIIQRGNKSGEK